MFKKHIVLVDNIKEYLEASRATLAQFCDAVKYSLQNGIDEHFEVLVDAISSKEQECDDLRLKIEHTMYAQSLLPETREDLIEIIEMIDEIPNHCEDVSGQIIDQNIEFYPELKKHVEEILDISINSFGFVIDASLDVIGSMEQTPELVRRIDECKNVCYMSRRKLIRKIFNTKKHDHNFGPQILQRDIVMGIEELSTLCKNVAEKITIISIKRRV